MSVTKAQVIAENRHLTADEMQINATYIYQRLRLAGWSVEAIAATLANMQAESGINAGVYESLDATSETNGFGLVQWTPNTKYKTWADANGYAYNDIDGQIARILYEVEHGLQWIETDTFPLSFEDYTKAVTDVGTLAYVFMYNYERPADLNQPVRQLYAEAWYTFLQNIDDTPTTGTGTPRPMSRLLFLWAGLRR